jgi:prolyl 4-hydroxylase
LELPPNSILQQEVDDPLLRAGRKFTTRVYVLVWNGEVRMFETGITVTHGVPYQRGGTDYSVQIDHQGYHDSASPVEVRPGYDDEVFIEHFPAQRDLVRKLRPILADCIEASDRDRYTLLGIDTLIRRDGTVRLIGINSYPNFIHTADVNKAVNVPLFEAVIRTITGHGDPRLEVI